MSTVRWTDATPLLEAGWAGPREAGRGRKRIRELGLRQARVRVVVDGVAKAASEQLAPEFALLALARHRREAGALPVVLTTG